MALPSAYKEVEYIQSSGTQYINTWLYPNPYTKTEAKYQETTYVSYSTLFGTRNGSYGRYLFRYSTDGNKITVHRSASASSSYQYIDTAIWYDHNDHIVLLNYEFYLDSTLLKTFTSPSDSTAFPYSLYLFALNDKWTANDYWYYKLYYFKIYDSGTLVRDFIPVIRKSDNKPWLYDLVNDQFYTNAGTGEFNYKEYAKSWKIQKIYIGVNQSRPWLSEHTVIYDNIPFKTEYPIAESWYNIKQIILEWSAHYSLTSWQINQIFLTSPSNSNLRLRTDWQLWWTYWYDYGEWIWKYVWQTFDVNSNANHYSVFASPSSSYAWTYDNAWYVTITKDTVNYKIWKTYWTWLWSWTTTLSTQLKWYMETLLNSSDIYCKRNTWDSNDLFTYYKVTVTYEPV